MKKIILLGLLAGAFMSCSSDDDGDGVVADFTATVSGEAPNAELTLQNKSTGASTYKWSFSEGTETSELNVETPPKITIGKTGVFTIKLVAENGSDKKEVSKTVTITGHNAITTFKDLEFAHAKGSTSYGRFFSVETGRIYKDSEINATTGPLISLGFVSWDRTMYFFESPDISENTKVTVPGATTTKVNNYQDTPPIAVAAFETMTDDRLLSALTIENTNESFGNSSANSGTILFETSKGKKGIILTKGVNADRLLVDIKVQKY